MLSAVVMQNKCQRACLVQRKQAALVPLAVLQPDTVLCGW
jgi:hypothetical protein